MGYKRNTERAAHKIRWVRSYITPCRKDLGNLRKRYNFKSGVLCPFTKKVRKRMDLNCCGKYLNTYEVWLLRDTECFTARKLFLGKCPKCGEPIVGISQTNKKDKISYSTSNIRGLLALQTLYRERKQIIRQFKNVSKNSLSGWVYGKNVELKNKKGDVVQVRRYAADLASDKKALLEKEICATRWCQRPGRWLVTKERGLKTPFSSEKCLLLHIQ